MLLQSLCKTCVLATGDNPVSLEQDFVFEGPLYVLVFYVIFSAL